MKRILSTAILVAAVVQVSTAQIITSKNITRISDRAKINLQKGYRGFVEIGGGISLTQSSSNYGLDFSTTHGYQINNWLFVGGGIGVQTFRLSDDIWGEYSNKTQWLLPLYADIKTYFTRTACKPFAELRLGYEIKCSKPATYSDSYYDDYYDVFFEHIQQIYIKSGLHFGIGVGVEYKRFSIKMMYRIHKRAYDYNDYRNYTPDYSISD